MTFSEKLAAAMQEKQISIRELSEMTGIPKSAIQRYTSGDTEKIPIDRMMKMADALNVDPAYIMGWNFSTLRNDIGPALGSGSPAAQKLRDVGDQLKVPDLDAFFPDKPDVRELVNIYDSLNDLGRQALMGTARGLAANPDMKKDGALNDVTA